MKKKISFGVAIAIILAVSLACLVTVKKSIDDRNYKSFFARVPMPRLLEVPEMPTPIPALKQAAVYLNDPAAEVGDVLVAVGDDFSRDIVEPFADLPVETLVDFKTSVQKFNSYASKSLSIAYASVDSALGSLVNRKDSGNSESFIQKAWVEALDAVLRK